MQQRHRHKRRAYKWTAGRRRQVESKPRLQWSPEQISGWLVRHHGFSLSHERMYQHLCADRAGDGSLYTHVRHRSGSRRSPCSTTCKGDLPNRVSIDDRPPIVEGKTRIGDWEGDLMMGGQGGGALATLVDRKSRWTHLQRVVHTKQAEEVADNLIQGLKDHREKVHTLTVDNGTEFAQHEKVAKALKADVYFAHPYCAWERGLDENTNGLLRPYFPKGANFRIISDATIRQVEKGLNERPRKALEFRTPREIFDEKDIDPQIVHLKVESIVTTCRTCLRLPVPVERNRRSKWPAARRGGDYDIFRAVQQHVRPQETATRTNPLLHGQTGASRCGPVQGTRVGWGRVDDARWGYIGSRSVASADDLHRRKFRYLSHRSSGGVADFRWSPLSIPVRMRRHGLTLPLEAVRRNISTVGLSQREISTVPRPFSTSTDWSNN